MTHNNLFLSELLQRKSHNRLVQPAPTEDQLQLMFSAALRAPDHALLKPWRYRVYQGVALEKLGDMFLNASLMTDPNLAQEKQRRIKLKPLRAPMVVIASMIYIAHKKVPKTEQILSAGASIQNLLLAAHGLDIGAIWRTGSLAFDRNLMDAIDMSENESIMGFIYLGQEQGEKKPISHPDQKEFVEWIN